MAIGVARSFARCRATTVLVDISHHPLMRGSASSQVHTPFWGRPEMARRADDRADAEAVTAALRAHGIPADDMLLLTGAEFVQLVSEYTPLSDDRPHSGVGLRKERR
jgi:hypothetical protein